MGKFKTGTYVNKSKKKGKKRKELPYIRICAGPLRGQYVHRIVMAAALGRDLNEDETVDHQDGDTLNPHHSNLKGPISYEEHGRITAARQKKKKAEEDKVPF